MMKRSISESYQEKMRDSIHNLVDENLDGMVVTTANYLEFLSQDSNVIQATYYATAVDSTENLEKQLGNRRNELRLSFLEVVDLKGRVVHSTMTGQEGKQIDQSVLFQRAREGNQEVRMERNDESGHFRIHSAVLIKRNKKPLAIIQGGYILDNSLLSSLSQAGTNIAIYDKSGELSAATAEMDIPRELITEILFKGTSDSERTSGDDAYNEKLHVSVREEEVKGMPHLVAAVPIQLASKSPVGFLVVFKEAGKFASVLFVNRGVVRPLNRIVAGFTETAEQVSTGAGQVSSNSQRLAEGSSEQAASIEETSSSLEEMSSMTKQNADNANQADNLMKEANQVVGQANDSMGDLTTSMEEISKASEETSKIIKTIDEIAFQTNLLALNAAVEAARAGEAGAGFAVVADEVRNLAMRAADAAKNTAELIEGTVKKTKDGTELVTRTNKAFGEVATSSAKVGELVGEIAAASNEQAHGIEQVNKAVTEMDKVVQQNAANAEESASASEEMNSQAEQMKSMVKELVVLVGGSAGAAKAVSQTQVRAPAAAKTRFLAVSTKKRTGSSSGKGSQP
jgi:X-X-X-Leu-X-X-Gly heptad repeat protein